MEELRALFASGERMAHIAERRHTISEEELVASNLNVAEQAEIRNLRASYAREVEVWQWLSANLSGLLEDRARALTFWRWAYALNVAGAQLALKLRNAEQREAGEESNWPAQSEWNGLVSTSHSVFLREARELAGIDHDAFLAIVRGSDDFAWAADAIYEAALNQPAPSSAKAQFEDSTIGSVEAANE